MTKPLNQSGRPVLTFNVPAKASPLWQLPLIHSFLRLETNGTRDGSWAVFRLTNHTESRLSLNDTFNLRSYASTRHQHYPCAANALNMAFRKAADAGLMTVEINFPGQIPTLD